MNGRANENDLLQPALRGVRRVRRGEGDQPWRLGSQLYVGFFGGPLALAAIAWFNSDRLGMPKPRRLLIPLVGLAGFLAMIVAAVATEQGVGGSQRLLLSVAGVASFGILFLLQRSPDRVYHAFADGDENQVYDSLWGPGLAATVGFGLLQVAILLAL